MKVLRGLTWRIVAASVLCGLVGLAASLLIVGPRTIETARLVSGPVLLALAHHERARCEADPSRWSLVLDGGAEAYAFDAVTLRSQNRAAPPIDDVLVGTLRSAAGELPIAFRAQGFTRDGALLMRMNAAGPCALVQAHWSRQRVRMGVTYAVLASMVAIIGSAVGLALIGVMRPLTRRILRLRQAADTIGAASGFARVIDPRRDELSELADRIAAAHERIRSDARALEQRERELRTFVADISHDLRTPLSSLHVALEQALDACGEPAVAELLGLALDDAVYISGLTTNLRLASLLREGWDPVRESPRVDLTATIERVVARERIFARHRGITLEVGVPDAPVFVECNPIAAEQAITNIVENAVAHGDAGGRVAAVLDVTQDAFRVTVLDDGPGVPPRELPRLGERAFRSDAARRRDPRGSGLGLAITREVADRCGWTLSFSAVEPRGLRVEIAGACETPPARPSS